MTDDNAHDCEYCDGTGRETKYTMFRAQPYDAGECPYCDGTGKDYPEPDDGP
jgi:DnaJ-class molecular chaperone